jgi:hypothetical protein
VLFKLFSGQKQNHPLPKFPPGLRPRFQSLCEPLDITAIDQLRQEFVLKTKETRARAEKNVRMNKRRLDDLIDRCELLLDVFPDVAEQQRALIVGALRYFVVDGDQLSDEAFCTGFDDDARIVNFVLEQLSIEGKFIAIS